MIGALRLILRVGVLLCLATAAILLIVESQEYPGVSRAGLLVAVRELLPLALVSWLNLGVLASTAMHPRIRRTPIWLAGSALGNIALLVQTLPDAKAGAPPISIALPVIAAVQLLSVVGLAFARRQRLTL